MLGRSDATPSSCRSGPSRSIAHARLRRRSDGSPDDRRQRARRRPMATDRPGPRIETLAEGTGRPVEIGETVRVHYVASVPGGAVLHDSHEGGIPSEIILGSTKTICGFERALLGMRPGEQRRVLVPWSLAFGETGRPQEIPPRTDVVFVIDLYLPANAVLDNSAPPPLNPARGGGRR